MRIRNERNWEKPSFLVITLLVVATVLACTPSVSAADVPALDTSVIGPFAYIKPADSIQIEDVLPSLYAFEQHEAYVDGVMRVWDTGSESPAPNNYCDVYVRVRTDGWMIAFFPDDENQGNDAWNNWTLGNYQNRGDLVWWGHTSGTWGYPPANSTRLGRALYELWDAAKENSDNPSYVFDYSDVGYYDYQFESAAKLHIFGMSHDVNTHTNRYCYFSVPNGTKVYSTCFSWGLQSYYGAYLNDVVIERYDGSPFYTSNWIATNGFWVSRDYSTDINLNGTQNVLRCYSYDRHSLATVILSDA